jgi:hypothetical protein
LRRREGGGLSDGPNVAALFAMGALIIRFLAFAAKRARTICLTLTLITVGRLVWVALLDRLQPAAESASFIDQPRDNWSSVARSAERS